MLEFICRTYSDDQLPITVRDLSTELIDMMSAGLNKNVFIKIFNDAQMTITKARQDRKMKSKIMAGT